MILCRSGRGTGELIEHLFHLDATGWCLFFAIVVGAIILTSISKRLIHRMMRAKGRAQFPQFEWIVIPQMGWAIGAVFFFFFLSFLGRFSSISEDISYFRYMGLCCSALLAFVSYTSTKQDCAIMRNRGELYLARYAGMGKFIAIKELPNCVFIAQASDSEIVYKVQYGDTEKKIFGYIKPSGYSPQGQMKINELKQSNEITILLP